MTPAWPPVDYAQWSETCDTLHAHTQVLGKLAGTLAPPEAAFQHLALRLTARGWETYPLRAPDGSGVLSAALDLRRHQALVEHSAGETREVSLTPDRPVGEVTREVLEAVRALAGPVEIDPAPQEVWWSDPLDSDESHRHYDPAEVSAYFAAASRAALVLGGLRAAHPGHAGPVSAWWGSFDVAVTLFAGSEAAPVEEVSVGWWPGDPKYPKAAFYGYARPAPEGLAEARLAPEAARWDEQLGEFVLDWEDVRTSPDPHGTALTFGQSLVRQVGIRA